MRKTVILSALRTPIGSFGGSLSSLSATELGGMAIKAALNEAGVAPESVNEVYMGNVLSANLGQAPATQAAKYAGLPDVPASTINKVCASGMKSVMLAAQGIACDAGNVYVAGGMESMSNVPYYIAKARTGYKLGNGELTDGLVKDGLWDVYNNYHMGNAAELCATNCSISREQQDEYAVKSYKRAQAAIAGGNFNKEIAPVTMKDKKGVETVIDTDEEPANVKFDKIAGLKPVFDKSGTVTAANASTLNDGAAALVVAAEDYATANGLKPLARILGFADAQQEPEYFTTSPAKAIPLALAKAGLTIADIDLFEINEAFSVVALANNQLLQLDAEKVNINGGAVAMGHPLGASGARIMVTLLHALKAAGKKYGCAAICNGGGGASAIIIEAL